MKLEERVFHVLMGIAYGDSLGMPSESMTPKQISKNFGYINSLLPNKKDPLLPNNERNLLAGQVTDDTANSIFITKMLINFNGKINKKDYVQSLIHWLDTDDTAASVSGPSTMIAVNAIKKGVAIEKAGIRGTTNGASMKIGPMGLVYDYHEEENLVKAVAEVCVPTHNTQIAIQGAAIVATLVSYFFRNFQIDWEVYFKLVERAALIAKNYGNKLPSPDIMKRIMYGKKISDELSESDFQDELYGFLGTGLDTIQMVPAAVSLVYRYKGDLKHCALVAANIGGDTDTLASICGAICGGYNFNIDEQDIRTIQKVNNIDFVGLSKSIARLLEKKSFIDTDR
ncbi:MAG TPA: ADP-ribosylglycohydrolase [Lactobacillus sp.]|nr:ADP-ribosylglycohydrolase [Lactobacillus sp.]